MPSSLTASQRATLRAACDVFVPPDPEHPGLTGDALCARVEAMIGGIEDPAARDKLLLLLGALGNPFANLAFGAGMKSLAAMSADARARFLLDMGDSAIVLRRAGFQALKKLVCVAHYAYPAADGSHPAWRAAGYPGPLPHAAGEDNTPLRLFDPGDAATIDCDVLVIGSGAGGGVAAGVLAQAGRDVVVLEKGAYQLPKDFTHVEGEALRDNFLGKALIANESGSMTVLAGSGLGGGTTINYTTSFRLPDGVADEWNRRAGVTLFGSARLRESFDRVEARINVTTEWSAPSRRDQILEDGCRALGWHSGVIPRNVRGCPGQKECGYCGSGCRHRARQSTTETYLADAVAAGARIITGAEARRVTMERGAATGAEVRVTRADGRLLTVMIRAKTVIVACGAIETPALLARSGIANARIGKGLRLHPATALAATFDEDVRPWEGFQQTRYSDQHAGQQGGYGVKFETASMGFALAASAFGWENAARHRASMNSLGRTSIVGLLLRDRDGGRIDTGRDGRARVEYETSDFDLAHLRAGLRAAAELLATQGAREIFTLQQPPVRVTPGAAGWLDGFMRAVDARGLGPCRQALFTFHQMASCAMGADPVSSVVAENGAVHWTKGLYVADASVFPTSSGVNPMLTIMAIADHVARSIA